MSPCFLGVTLMQHGNVSNIASFSKKNDDLRYVSLTWNLKVVRAACYKQEQAIYMKRKKSITVTRDKTGSALHIKMLRLYEPLIR